MKKKYKKLAGGKNRLPKNVMVLTNLWTANQNADAPTSSGTVTGAVGAITFNNECGVITVTGFTAAAGATETITINCNKVLTTSRVFVNIMNYTGVIVTNGIPAIVEANITGAGVVVVTVINLHGANALAGNLVLAFQVGQIVQ